MTATPSYHDERFWTRYLARRAAPCPNCRYDLRGGRSPACPECGHVASLHELRTQADPTEEQWHVSGAWALAAATLFGIVPGVTLVAMGTIRLFGGKSFLPELRDAIMAIGIGLVLSLGPAACLWLWRRGARRLHRWPELFKWLLVLLACAMALFCAMTAVGTIALLGA
jgi:hypothetical protein